MRIKVKIRGGNNVGFNFAVQKGEGKYNGA